MDPKITLRCWVWPMGCEVQDRGVLSASNLPDVSGPYSASGVTRALACDENPCGEGYPVIRRCAPESGNAVLCQRDEAERLKLAQPNHGVIIGSVASRLQLLESVCEIPDALRKGHVAGAAAGIFRRPVLKAAIHLDPRLIRPAALGGPYQSISTASGKFMEYSIVGSAHRAPEVGLSGAALRSAGTKGFGRCDQAL